MSIVTITRTIDRCSSSSMLLLAYTNVHTLTAQRSLLQIVKKFYAARQKDLYLNRPMILLAAECRSMILISKYIRNTHIFAGVPR